MDPLVSSDSGESGSNRAIDHEENLLGFLISNPITDECELIGPDGHSRRIERDGDVLRIIDEVTGDEVPKVHFSAFARLVERTPTGEMVAIW